jgi:hypothetical protein
MKFSAILSLFFILLSSCFQTLYSFENFVVQDTDMLSSSFQNAADSLDILKKQIGAFAKKKDYASAISYSKKLRNKAAQIPDSSFIANALWRQGFYFKKLDQLDSAFFYFNKAYTVSSKTKDSISAGDRLSDMANIQKSLGDYNGSMITAIEGLKFIVDSKEVETIIGLYQNISVAQKELGNYNEALRWNTKISDLLTKMPKTKLSVNNYYIAKITKANILAEQKKYLESIAILDSIINNTKNTNDFEYARAISNMGHFKWLNNAKNPESESLLLVSLGIREKLKSTSGLISSNIHLAEYYYDTDKTKALNFATKAYEQSLKLNNGEAILESLDLVLHLKQSLGLNVSDEAITYSQIQNKLEKSKQAIRAIYAASKYDNDHLEKENLKLSAAIAIQEKQTIIAISAVGFSFFLIGFIVFYKNQQKKREKLEETYKTELRFSKKIHDELGNDIHYMITQVQNDESYAELPQSGIILNSLDTIYKRVRDISKDFTLINTNEKFGDDFTILLNSYSSNSIKIITKELPVDFWKPVPKQAKIELFRVVQELLTNMKKHSGASFVAITCARENKVYTLKYVDNGVGFDQNEKSFGIGLKNVENRMQAIKGSITFETKPNEGVTILITFST